MNIKARSGKDFKQGLTYAQNQRILCNITINENETVLFFSQYHLSKKMCNVSLLKILLCVKLGFLQERTKTRT